MPSNAATVVVTGANGFVGSGICQALVARGARVRAIVRSAGTAPDHPRITEVVGDFTDDGLAGTVVPGAYSVITTVHPMGRDRATLHRVAVEGTPVLARAAAAAGVQRLIHISTAAVYDRSPGIGDIDESAALVADDAGDYPVTKRNAERALDDVRGITRVLLRAPAILGVGPTSTWNTLRPAAIRDLEPARHAIAEQTFPWVHLTDLAALAADLAIGRTADTSDPARGPIGGACTPLNVAGQRATQRDYFEAVTSALGVKPVWKHAPAWAGRLRTDRAQSWGWKPTVDLAQALDELVAGLRTHGFRDR